MEDRTSKKQWRKNDMAKDDYVTPANTITDASALDYLKRTVRVALGGGALHLSFAVQFRLLLSTRVAKYTFKLDPVSVERIDVLESKLRDQQKELERLRAGRALPFGRFEASTKDANTGKLLWNAVEPDFFHVGDGEVMVLKPGVYSVGAVVNNTPRNYDYNAVLQLKEGDTMSVECGGNVGSICYRTIA
ncbi:hypothetical protein V7S43_013733 [Phytophthora oleae]|uniref:Uncharacterized protein n=1 Tax=Phytophthora oleae TaxID=2107226 RepID=A0ABD3F4D6_9STRA